GPCCPCRSGAAGRSCAAASSARVQRGRRALSAASRPSVPRNILTRAGLRPKHRAEALPPGALPFRRRLLGWYDRHRRDLPWRGVRDPYAVLVSEVMLQQTQVARVMDYYPRFLRAYPSLEELASASADAVRETWRGLGYYARARNLHATARQVVRTLDGNL